MARGVNECTGCILQSSLTRATLSLCGGKQQVSLGWGAGGLKVQRLWQPLTNPPALPWLERKKRRRCQEGLGKSKRLGIGFTLVSTWPCCWLYLYPGRTALAFSPRELLSSANKTRIWLLPIWFPQLQAEALRLVLVTFNPYRYMVMGLRGWVRWAFQGCYHGFWLSSVMQRQNPPPDSDHTGFWKLSQDLDLFFSGPCFVNLSWYICDTAHV